MLTRECSCDLCGGKLLVGLAALGGSLLQRPIGLRWGLSNIVVECPADEAERHICRSCLSGLQAFRKICGDGHECPSGPICGSDHK